MKILGFCIDLFTEQSTYIKKYLGFYKGVPRNLDFNESSLFSDQFFN